MLESLSGEVVRVTFENETTQFRVLRVEVDKRGLVTAVGKFQFVAKGAHVRLTGEFQRDARHGEQFLVHTLVTIEPSTLAGIEKYLGSGLIPGVGPGFAKRIVAEFGLETLKVLDHTPERLVEVSGLGTARADEIRARWGEQRAIGSLAMLLQSHGIGIHLVRRIFERYGDRSSSIVQTSPYRLAIEVRGVGFKTADAIAASFGIAKDHPDRAQAGAYHCLRELSDQGHVFITRTALVEAAAAMLDVDEVHVSVAIDALRARERLVVEEDRVYLAELHQAEFELAKHIARLSHAVTTTLPAVDESIASFEKHFGGELAGLQRQAVHSASTHAVSVVTGGPGVGKTTLVRAILSVFSASHLTTALAAPTGRAAKRLSEATGQRASTLHRLLEFEPKLRRFQRNSDSPLDASAYIVDEASMIDVQLAASLFAAVPTGARVVIVGDADQLPSVGPGAMLRDLIQSQCVQVVRLNEIFRQAEQSRIVRSAHLILRGEPPVSADPEEAGADFFIVERRDPEQAARTVEELVTKRIPRRFGLDPFNDIQVLCPMHRGQAGTIAINQALQAALNPTNPGLERRGTSYRQGDRVMQLRNDYDKAVFNGDLGRITRVDTENLELDVQFEERSVRYSEAELEDVTLAYATSIHKSQGSEYPAVVIPFLTSHFVMLSRNLLYTAVTRARRVCVLVSDPRAIRLALSEFKKDARNTTLAARLQNSRHLLS
jgi:exodeoxyribonuclease V alpha subunit